ncbi:YbjN domain-containing protein [Corallincola platygyrae]|uniref:YbjN domain-containing protein n=1 Tax=Corallincola platygyrae TaxID=1193278 RepID=A0ABW4XKA4_9GAMM
MVNTLIRPDRDQVKHWLESLEIPTYICDNCQALHLPQVQEMEGVLESRLFVDEEWMLLSTEAEIKPSGLLHLMAELGNINAAWPTTKIFVDIQDDSLPRLVVSQSLFVGAAITMKQFEHFFNQTIEIVEQVIGECHDNGVLVVDNASASKPDETSNIVH